MPTNVRRNFLAALMLAGLFILPAHAGTSDCLSQLHDGAAPVLTNQKLTAKTRQLCYSKFVLLHSGVTRTPLWSAEHLTAKRIKAARGLKRPSQSAFHAEEGLPEDERSELTDYTRSGYDRGHMSPSGDMPGNEAQQESFSLANMIPQHPCNNEVLWEGIESAVRDLTLSAGEVFAVTGPAFTAENLNSLRGRVIVPTHVFKAIYVPSRDAAGAYWAPNDGSQIWEPVSIARLQELTGIDVFPKLAPAVKQASMPLPQPAPHHRCRLSNSD